MRSVQQTRCRVQWKTTVNQQQSFRFHKRQRSCSLSDSILNVQEELCTLALVLLCLFWENTDNVEVILFSVNVVFNQTAVIRLEERLFLRSLAAKFCLLFCNTWVLCVLNRDWPKFWWLADDTGLWREFSAFLCIPYMLLLICGCYSIIAHCRWFVLLKDRSSGSVQECFVCDSGHGNC